MLQPVHCATLSTWENHSESLVCASLMSARSEYKDRKTGETQRKSTRELTR